MDALGSKLDAVREALRSCAPVLVAYSGGVDSSLLLALAVRTLGGAARGVIADSPSLPRAALERALRRAESFGARVEVLATAEFDDPRYAANPQDRCRFCKTELFARMEELAARSGHATLAYGENADDPPALRPGSAAARDYAVRAPLREAGLGKAEVRAAARAMRLEAADDPAQPCLSSRIPHGTPVTREAVALIERSEEALRAFGFRVLRVRLASSDPPRALVQVAPSELERLRRLAVEADQALRAAGFASVEIDPSGYVGAGLL